jgi:hypothetical protein
VNLRIDDPSAMGKLGESVVLPFEGDIQLADPARLRSGERIALLRTGTVSLIGRTLFGGSLYSAGKVTLDVGDLVTIIGPLSPAVGIVTMNEQPGFQLSTRVVADRIGISRFGSQGYFAHLSLLERIQNDGPVQASWLCFVLLFGAVWKKMSHKSGKADSLEEGH